MNKVIVIRFGEIFLKGKNYAFFENTLFSNIKYRLKNIKLKLERIQGRFIVSNYAETDETSIIEILKNIFGIVSISVAVEVQNNIDEIKQFCKKIKLQEDSFKVETNRADKTFCLKSFEISSIIGEEILKNNPEKIVDVHNPKETISLDIRQNGKTYIFYKKIDCLGGMPVGTSGKGMLLLSGGIDSPVAGFQMAKRGLKINAIHFHSYPYTSEQAKQKVIDLANIIKKYTGDIDLYFVPFTKIQEEIHKNCDDEYMVILVRRFMMRIAEIIAKKAQCSCLITGENLAQVASQTVQSITVTNKMAYDLPIFRPLISFDKIEITSISKRIGALETSVLPYEDCCSVFLPKNPVTHPKMDHIQKNEAFLDAEKLINDAIDKIEVMHIKN